MVLEASATKWVRNAAVNSWRSHILMDCVDVLLGTASRRCLEVTARFLALLPITFLSRSSVRFIAVLMTINLAAAMTVAPESTPFISDPNVLVDDRRVSGLTPAASHGDHALERGEDDGESERVDKASGPKEDH